MSRTCFSEFAVDNASILFLSLLKPYHNNNFRFSVMLDAPVCPEALQKAVDRVTPRFPSVIARLRQDFLCYRQLPVEKPPQVMKDPGMLHPMSPEELAESCFRVYYEGNTVFVEAFHAMTDGCGAIITVTTLIAEYMNILTGVTTPAGPTRLDVSEGPKAEEVVDSFLDFADAPPKHLPSRFSYLPPRDSGADWQVKEHRLTLDVAPALAAAKKNGVSLNTMLTAALAETVMELQMQTVPGKKKPVRIMVPVDLRRLTGSRTLRNFSLYTLPTMEASQYGLPFPELCRIFGDQLKQQLSKEALMGMVSYNVKSQNAWYFKIVPWKVKAALLRLGYKFFGESNSSLTLTNLGPVDFPAELKPHIVDFQCYLTPRVSSPYGCTVMTFNGKLSLNMSHFNGEDTVGNRFYERLKELVEA